MDSVEGVNSNEWKRHAQILIYQSTPAKIRNEFENFVSGKSRDETNLKDEKTRVQDQSDGENLTDDDSDGEYNPFTTTIFSGQKGACNNCALGCDDEGHYSLSLMFEL